MDTKPRLRLVVSLHGGTVQDIFSDNPEIEITDVVFTEYAKYGNPAEKEFPVNGGPLQNEIIYTHHAGVTQAGSDLFDPVMAAAEARANDPDV